MNLRRWLALCILVFWPLQAAAQQTRVTLSCIGFDGQLNAAVEWLVQIDGDSATIAGQRLSVETADTHFWLTGNFLAGGRWQTGRIAINRYAGNFFAIPDGPSNRAVIWTRPQDAGCAVAKPKF